MQAVCCSDGVHCCPGGTTCDVSSEKCDHGDIQLDWFVKQPALKVGGVKCDATHECPSENTCCKLASGQWGCCPRPNVRLLKFVNKVVFFIILSSLFQRKGRAIVIARSQSLPSCKILMQPITQKVLKVSTPNSEYLLIMTRYSCKTRCKTLKVMPPFI